MTAIEFNKIPDVDRGLAKKHRRNRHSAEAKPVTAAQLAEQKRQEQLAILDGQRARIFEAEATRNAAIQARSDGQGVDLDPFAAAARRIMGDGPPIDFRAVRAIPRPK